MPEWLPVLDKIGTVAILLSFYYALYKRWFVTKAHYDDLCAQRDKLQQKNDHLIDLALRGTTLAESWSSVVQRERP